MLPFVLLSIVSVASAAINRRSVIARFNPQRVASSETTPMQVGNGNFAFGADVTGLQTFQPFNILSSWCWHNSSLPTGQTPEDFTGLDWWTHGRLVNYAQPNPAQREISQWLRGNPHRVNLGRIGLSFGNRTITEADLQDKQQTLDLNSGLIRSSFRLDNELVQVQTVGDPDVDLVAFSVQSKLLGTGALSVFFDYPYSTDKIQFEAPYVGVWNETERHQTSVVSTNTTAVVCHDQDATTYYTSIHWETDASFAPSGPSPHRYELKATSGDRLRFSAQFAPDQETFMVSRRADISFAFAQQRSGTSWSDYWNRGAFIDMTKSSSPQALELQRRIVLSQYLTAVNGASKDPPQESGLTNNGWYGKFHMEMVAWHNTHWALWNKWDLFERCLDVYRRFLPSSFERARLQGYEGARWGKMSDPSGRSAPGEINSLLIWQQPHPIFLAELEYQAFPNAATLEKWHDVVVATADFMASYAFWNESTNRYDLGPPMYPVSENTPPNSTINPTFELAYWRFGLSAARNWYVRQGLGYPEKWDLYLAPLPTEDDTYITYEGIPDMWGNKNWTTDHPGVIGILGLLPPVTGVNVDVLDRTLARVYETYDLELSYGWDFPMLAMSSARRGDPQKAVDMLTHEKFAFDDVGMPVGGVRVPTPYFPMSTSLLFAVAGMAAGWRTQSPGANRWPEGWIVEAEGFVQPL